MKTYMKGMFKIVLYLSFLSFSGVVYADVIDDIELLEERINDLPENKKKTAIKKLNTMITELNNKNVEASNNIAKTKNEDEEVKGVFGWIDNNFSIHKSVRNKNDLGDPASVAFTFPDDGENSYTVDVGVSWFKSLGELSESWSELDKWIVSGTVEYHRNSLIDKEQATTLAGVSTTYQWGDAQTLTFDDSARITGVKNHLHSYFDFAVDYKLDDVKNTESALFTIRNTPVYANYGLGTVWHRKDSWYGYGIDINYGLDYEDIFNEKNNSDGEVVRFNLNTGLYFYPFHTIEGQRIELVLKAMYWEELYHHGAFDDGNSSFFNYSTALRYYFDNKKRLGMSLKYVNGEDPKLGQDKQDFFWFGLTFQTSN